MFIASKPRRRPVRFAGLIMLTRADKFRSDSHVTKRPSTTSCRHWVALICRPPAKGRIGRIAAPERARPGPPLCWVRTVDTRGRPRAGLDICGHDGTIFHRHGRDGSDSSLPSAGRGSLARRVGRWRGAQRLQSGNGAMRRGPSHPPRSSASPIAIPLGPRDFRGSRKRNQTERTRPEPGLAYSNLAAIQSPRH